MIFTHFTHLFEKVCVFLQFPKKDFSRINVFHSFSWFSESAVLSHVYDDLYDFPGIPSGALPSPPAKIFCRDFFCEFGLLGNGMTKALCVSSYHIGSIATILQSDRIRPNPSAQQVPLLVFSTSGIYECWPTLLPPSLLLFISRGSDAPYYLFPRNRWCCTGFASFYKGDLPKELGCPIPKVPPPTEYLRLLLEYFTATPV